MRRCSVVGRLPIIRFTSDATLGTTKRTNDASTTRNSRYTIDSASQCGKPQALRAELRERRRDDREHERQEHETEEVPEQPEQAEQDYPDDDAPIALIELVEAEGRHGRLV